MYNYTQSLKTKTQRGLVSSQKMFAALLENFVISELFKQLSWSAQRVKLFHFRTSTGTEVDFILENSGGSIVAIEVKSSTTVNADDFKGLKSLQEIMGDRFVRGIVLYTGTHALPFGNKLEALPLASLWIL